MRGRWSHSVRRARAQRVRPVLGAIRPTAPAPPAELRGGGGVVNARAPSPSGRRDETCPVSTGGRDETCPVSTGGRDATCPVATFERARGARVRENGSSGGARERGAERAEWLQRRREEREVQSERVPVGRRGVLDTPPRVLDTPTRVLDTPRRARLPQGTR